MNTVTAQSFNSYSLPPDHAPWLFRGSSSSDQINERLSYTVPGMFLRHPQ